MRSFKLQRSNWRSKTKEGTPFNRCNSPCVEIDACLVSKRKGDAAMWLFFDLLRVRSLSGWDDVASQGRQDNDFEAPQATQTAVLFPFRIQAIEAVGSQIGAMPKRLLLRNLSPDAP